MIKRDRDRLKRLAGGCLIRVIPGVFFQVGALPLIHCVAGTLRKLTFKELVKEHSGCNVSPAVRK